MLRLAFLLLVVVGALAVVISLFVGVGLYQVAKLQDPGTDATSAPVAATAPTSPASPTPPATGPSTAGAPIANADRSAAEAPVARPPVDGRPPADDVAGAPPAGRDAAVPDPAVRPENVPPLTLLAKDAVLIGDVVRLDPAPEPTIVDWRQRSDGVEWNAQVPATGIYDVEITYASTRLEGGGVFTLRAGPRTVSTSVTPTGGWDQFQSRYIGKVYLAAGPNPIHLRPVYLLPDAELMRLRSVKLTFVKAIDEAAFESLYRRRRGF